MRNMDAGGVPSTTATHRCFAIYELLHQILGYVDDGKTLLGAQRTCRLFNAHVQAIKKEKSRPRPSKSCESERWCMELMRYKYQRDVRISCLHVHLRSTRLSFCPKHMAMEDALAHSATPEGTCAAGHVSSIQLVNSP